MNRIPTPQVATEALSDRERAVAERALAQADNHCKTAIVMILAGLTADEARTRLQSSNGFISQCTH